MRIHNSFASSCEGHLTLRFVTSHKANRCHRPSKQMGLPLGCMDSYFKDRSASEVPNTPPQASLGYWER